jgi:hypothetical protein
MKSILYKELSSSIILTIFLSAPILLPIVSQAQQQKEATSVAEAFTGLKPWMSFRYRLETADIDKTPHNAYASTLRTRLGGRTLPFLGVSGTLEIENVSEIGHDNYNNSINGKTDYPVIADVESTEINQAYLLTTNIPKSELLIGRHTFSLDDHRFIGDVEWRQNNQTHDGAKFLSNVVEDLTFTYAYSWNVNRIFGDDSPVGDAKGDISAFHLQYTPGNANTLTLYSYLLDFDNLPKASSNTYGGFAETKQKLSNDTFFLLHGELAYQEGTGNKDGSYSTHYYRVTPALSYCDFTLEIQAEVLGSDNRVQSFQTPLATLHKFNGFADLFLTTPPTGLRDYAITGTYNFGQLHAYLQKVNFLTAWHKFESDEGGQDYGTEWDANLIVAITKNYYTGLKYANYNAEDFGADTERLILSLAATY